MGNNLSEFTIEKDGAKIEVLSLKLPKEQLRSIHPVNRDRDFVGNANQEYDFEIKTKFTWDKYFNWFLIRDEFMSISQIEKMIAYLFDSDYQKCRLQPMLREGLTSKQIRMKLEEARDRDQDKGELS